MLVITLAEVGGAQSYVAALLPALAERYEVVLAAHGEGPLRAAAAEAGARFVPLRHVRRPIRPWRDLAGLVELSRLLRRERPQILHASSSKAGVLGRLAAVATRVPIRFFTVHGWAFSAYSGLPSLLYRITDRLMAPLTTVTICVSENETWERYGQAALELARLVADDGYRPDIILSIARGGLVTAGSLSYALDVKNVHVVNVKFYTGVDERLEMPIVLPPVPNVLDLKDTRVLIADDVADTGATLQLARDICAEHVAEARCAVLYEKPQSLVQCEYVWARTDLWIEFPWSMEPPIPRPRGPEAAAEHFGDPAQT